MKTMSLRLANDLYHGVTGIHSGANDNYAQLTENRTRITAFENRYVLRACVSEACLNLGFTILDYDINFVLLRVGYQNLRQHIVVWRDGTRSRATFTSHPYFVRVWGLSRINKYVASVG